MRYQDTSTGGDDGDGIGFDAGCEGGFSWKSDFAFKVDIFSLFYDFYSAEGAMLGRFL